MKAGAKKNKRTAEGGGQRSTFFIPPEWTQVDWVIIAFLFISSSFLFFYNIEGQPFKGDEIVYGYYLDDMIVPANIIFPEGKLTVLYQIKPPLKTWLQYPLIRVFGFNHFTLRFWDSLFASASVVLIYLLGRLLAGRKAGFIAAFVVTAIPAIIWEHWARYNSYDSGFIFSILLFYYLFLTRFRSKWGVISCGFALAAGFYFKHIAMLLPLVSLAAWLVITKRTGVLFSRKFALMLLTAALLLGIWYIPFVISRPEFIKTFIEAELYSRLITGYTRVTSSPVFYIQTLPERLGPFFYPAVTAFLLLLTLILIKVILKTGRKNPHSSRKRTVFDFSLKEHSDKKLFLFLWVIIPFIFLEMSSSKLEWYLYPLYPAVFIILGGLLTELDSKIYLGKFRPNLLFMIFLFTASIGWLSNFKTVSITQKTPSQIYADFYTNNRKGKIYILGMGPDALSFSEKIDIYKAGEKLIWKTKIKSLESLFSRLQSSDSFILTRLELSLMLWKGPITPEADRMEYIDITRYYEITYPKIAVFPRDGELSDYLKHSGITVSPIRRYEELIDFSIADNAFFVKNLTKTVFGIVLPEDKKVFCADLLSKGRLTREQLAKRFVCISLRPDYSYINAWWDSFADETLNADILKIIIDFYDHKKPGRVIIFGMAVGSFTPEQLCLLQPTFAKWEFITYSKTKIQFTEIIPDIKADDLIIIRRQGLIRHLMKMKEKREELQRLSLIPLNLNHHEESLGRSNFAKTFLCLTDGNLYHYLVGRGVKVTPLKPLDEMIDWKIEDDELFVRSVSSFLFSIKYDKEFILKLMKRLNNCHSNREKFLQDLINDYNKTVY